MKNYDKSEDLDHPETEITLGMRSILGIFFGLVLICGVFFGFGYSLGRGNTKAVSPAQTAPQAPGTSSPSVVKTVVEEPAPSGNDPFTDSADSGNPAMPQRKPSPAASALVQASDAAKPATGAANFPSATQPTPASYNLPAPAKAAPSAYPAQASANPAASIMVQIAAVSRREDADVLLSALRKFGYSASVRSETADSLLHVQIGPFATRAQAIAMRAKLLNDGYNAILK
jgi:cell division septation protein DedD